MPPQSLHGARVQRVDAPFSDLLALSLYAPGFKDVLLISTAAPRRGLGICEQRPRGAPADGFVRALRKALGGSHLSTVEQANPGVVELRFTRGEHSASLVAHMFGDGNLLLVEGGRVRAARHGSIAKLAPFASPPGTRAIAVASSREELLASGERLLSGHAGRELSSGKSALTTALRRRDKQLQRRLRAIAADRERADEVEALRARAALVLSYLHAIEPDATSAVLLDDSSDPARRVELQFDPKLGPRRQAEAWFARARKLERGAQIAREREQLTQDERSAVLALLAEVETATTQEAVSEVEARARTMGVAPQDASATPGRRKRRTPRLPYREFVGAAGRSILVGRGAADNDRLTLDHARPHDLWLHARGHAGAHVVVPLGQKESCPSDLLCDAATLAAHFSQAHGEDSVDITYCQRRHVRKPRKSSAGQVLIEREKVFRLRLEHERLKRLLAAEVRRT